MDMIVSNEELEFEGEVQQNLRPKRLAEYIGQESLKEKMSIFIEAAKKRGGSWRRPARCRP